MIGFALAQIDVENIEKIDLFHINIFTDNYTL